MKKCLTAVISISALMVTPAFSAVSNEELLREIKALKAENAALRAQAKPHNVKTNKNSNTPVTSSNYSVPNNDIGSTPILPWTGFYAGLNAGGNIGTNSSVLTSSLWSPSNWASYDYALATPLYSQGSLPGGGGVNTAAMTQSGFIGGAQFGYNYQFNSKFLIGLEADFQGTTNKGSSSPANYLAGASSSYDVTVPTSTIYVKQNGYLINSTSSGTDWIGTVRGRVGYLVLPSLLIYGTGGLAYGQAWANVTMNGVTGNSYAWISPGTNSGTLPSTSPQGYISNGKSSSVLVGYSAGGGAEWMFYDNWSVKAEAIYWNIGNMSVSHTAATGSVWSPVGTPVPSFGSGVTYQSFGGAKAISGQSKFNYQGIIARLGVNYHFNLGAMPVIAKFQ